MRMRRLSEGDAVHHKSFVSGLTVLALLTGTAAQTYDLPLFFISTNGAAVPDEPKVSATMRVLDRGVNSPEDSLSGDSYAIGIEIRGQTSAYFDKKGYGIEIRDSAGDNKNVSLLGLPDENDWVLHGPYIDKTLIRNALTHYLYRATGRYSSRYRFVELFLNGTYDGVYLLLEKIKRDKDRVDISKITPEDTAGDELTGGYILRIDKSDDISSEGFRSSENLQFLYHYPQKEDMPESQQTYLKNIVNDFEQLMTSATWADSTAGYPSVLDVDAAVDYILLQEITKNSDAYDVSFYMYKDRDSRGGKITFGPPWDFNLAFGAVSYLNAMDTSGWEVENQGLTSGTYKIPGWLRTLFRDEAFQVRLKNRWATLRSSVWHTASIDGFIDSLSALLSGAATRNFNRWQVLGSETCVDLGMSGGMFGGATYTYNFCFNGYSEPTWPAEISHLKNWLHHRMEWMDSQFDFEPTGVAPVQTARHDAAFSLRRAGDRLMVKNLAGGRLSMYDMHGRLLWNTEISSGTAAVKIPACLNRRICVASLDGRRVLFTSVK